MMDLLFNTVLFLFKGNRNFFKLIDEFHGKLPPQHKRAKQEKMERWSQIDTTNMKMNLSTSEIDSFHKSIENFNYNLVFFKKKAIKEYSQNIQRLLATSGWEKFGVAIIQNLLEDDLLKRKKPYIFGYRIGQIIKF